MSQAAPVALFCAGLNGDGVARNTVHLANALDQRGVAVRVISLETGALADQLRPRVGLDVLGRTRGRRTTALALAVPALRHRLDRGGASVLVSMGNHAHLAAWAALRGRPELPRIYRISNDAGGAGRGLAVGKFRTATQRLIAADATRVISVSTDLVAAPPFRKAIRERRVEVMPNGVDYEMVQQLARAPVRHPWLEDGRPFLVAVGRLHPQKNYAALIAALALARRSDRQLRLLVLGGGAKAEAARLHNLVEALGLTECVTFAGEVANPFPFLARAAAYALTSRWEGASNSLLEAVACGAPVIASRTAGNAAEVLDHGRYGMLVDPTAPLDIAAAILRQVGDQRVPPGDRAQAFSLERTMDRACGLILSVRREHDEIQTFAARPRHAAALSAMRRGKARSTDMRTTQILIAAAISGLTATAAVAQASAPQTIGVARAVAAAEQATGGKAFEADLDTERGALVYEIDLVKDGQTVEAAIDAINGKLVRQSRPAKLRLPFGSDDLQAAQIAPRSLTETIAMVETATKGRVTDIGLEREGGRHYYEVELAGAPDREVRVDLRTGAITPVLDD